MSTPLHNAAAIGDIAAVKQLLNSGANVNARDEKGDTPLRRTPSAEVASLLLAKGANVNEANDGGLTPLHRACAVAGSELVHLYLQQGATIEAKTPEGVTPLLTAAMLGNDYQVVVLLVHGANPNVRNAAGRCSLREVGAQTVRDAMLVLAALDTIATEAAFQEAAKTVRQRIQEAIAQVAITVYRPPVDLNAPSSPQAATSSMQEHHHAFGQKTRELRNRLPEIQVAALKDYPTLDQRLKTEIEKLDKSNPVADPTAAHFQQSFARHQQQAAQQKQQEQAEPKKKKPWWKFW